MAASVFLEDKGDFFMGGTKEKNCKNTLRGATYATSIVRIFKDKIIIWDQGFNSIDKQTWGAEKGGYVFDKEESMKYPKTRRDTITDYFFNKKIADPYRWLEEENKKEVAKWIEIQNQTTFNHIGQTKYRKDIKNRLTEIWNYTKYSSPFL